MMRKFATFTALFLGLALSIMAPALANAEMLPFELVPQFGHGHAIQGVAVSEDGKVAASASFDQTVRVWAVQSGILLRVLAIGAQALDVGILRDGARAVVAYDDGLQLWDILRGKRLSTIKVKIRYGRLRLLHQRDAVVVGDRDGTVGLWDLSSQTLVRPIAKDKFGENDEVKDLDVSTDDRSLAVATNGGTVEIYDLETGRLIRSLVGHSRGAYVARFSKNGEVVTSVEGNSTIYQWDVKTGKVLRAHQLKEPFYALALVTDDTAVVGFYDGDAKVIDLTTGRMLRSLEAWSGVRRFGTARIAVTRDGRRSISADLHGAVLFSDLTDGTPIHATGMPRLGVGSLAVSPRGDKVAVGYGGADVDLWDVGLGARVSRLTQSGERSNVSPVAISPDGRLLFRAAGTSVFVHDTRSYELLRRLEAPIGFKLGSIAVSPNGTLVAVSGYPRSVTMLELDTGKTLWWDGGASNAGPVAFMPDGSTLVVSAGVFDPPYVYAVADGKRTLLPKGVASAERVEFLDRDTVLVPASWNLELWDLRTSQNVRKYPRTQHQTGAGAFTPDHKWVIGSYNSGQLIVYEGQSSKQLQPYQAHVDHVSAVVPSPDGRLVFSASIDGTVRVTPLATLTSSNPNSDPKPITWVADENDWLMYSVDGYFDASRRGGSLVAAVRGLEGYRIDQLAVRNNRPDLVLARLGLGTSESIAMYARRYQQRLKRLGIDETALAQNLMSAPQANITDFSRTGRKAHLQCKFEGNGRQLKRYFLFVNDVAVGDGEGKPLSGAAATVNLDVELSAGRNKIELSVLNDVGVESFRAVRTANVTDASLGNLYYLGFGVSNYKDSRLTLKFAHKDALDLGRTIEKMAGHGYDQVFSRTLTDSEVTKASVEAAHEFLAKAKLDDTVVVFVAGHGVFAAGANEQYYFVTYDTDISRIHETGASFNLIEDLVTGIAPRKKLLLLDTCQSGERDGDEEVVRVSAGNSRGLVARGIRPVVMSSVSSVSSTGVRPTVAGYQDRFIFNDLSRRSGTIVFSASHGSELSYEDDRLGNGIFTSELLHALSDANADVDKNGSVSTDELRAYVSSAVTTRTAGLQNPTVDRDNLEALFGFPVATTAAVDASPKTTVPATTQTNSAPPKRVVRRIPGK